MPARFFNILSSRLPKITKRRQPGGRRLHGFESLERREMMTAVPAYASLPGAPVTVYLDFDGHHEDEWGETYWQVPDAKKWTDVNTPVFSRDGDVNFSTTELDMIHKIWQCVAEDFAPFSINVTTVEPPAGTPHMLRVAVGGSWEDWYGESAGGISMIGSFDYDAYVNTVYAFSDEFSTARTIADCASQEIGHSFGLEHQRIWSDSGEIIEEYNPGTGESAPIMGVPYNSQRSLWWRDPTAENGWTDQDDMSIMRYGNGGFIDFRADDHGGGVSTATFISSPNITATGVISSNAKNKYQIDDRDAFIITLPSAGLFKHWYASLEVDHYSANLDAKIEVYKFSYTPGTKTPYGKTPPPPTLLGIADPGDDLGAFFDLGNAGGSFMIVVRSHGDYGDLGQYALKFYNANITIPNTNPIPLPPLVDVICDPSRPVVVGAAIKPIVAQQLNNQLGLLALSYFEKPKANGDRTAKTVDTDTEHGSPSLTALDAAFGQLGSRSFLL